MLEVDNIRVVYADGFEALRAASVKVAPGEVVALIGRSGAGKSTLLRCINGMQAIAGGRITLDGTDVTRLSPAERARFRRDVGVIWQEHNLVGRLSAFRNVLTGRLGYRHGFASLMYYFGRSDREIAVRSLERVDMLSRATQRADRLSGGEKQRVAIARALAQQPRLLLADEPVASLDAPMARQVLADLVRIARAERVPTIVTLHDLAFARAIGDRVIGLAGGATIFDGPPSRLDDVTLQRIYGSEWNEQADVRPVEMQG